ncbi:MAG: winged helix-turn-helix domain-containing protein, partial [Terriglobus sp.]
RILNIQGKSIHLTPKEFDLMSIFLKYPDRVLSHRTLAEAVWDNVNEGQTENLRVLVAQLRRKIEDDTQHYIVSEPWVGYTLRSNGD